jgi:hypothetical protein
MIQFKSPETLQRYADMHSHVVEYGFWDDPDENRREAAMVDFRQNKTYASQNEYPKIKDTLLNPILDYDMPPGLQKYDEKRNKIYDTPLYLKKSQVYEAVLELEANKKSRNWSEARCTVYADLHGTNLTKIFLVESASRLNDNTLSSQEHVVAREEFQALNEALFGEYDTNTFSGMLNTELGIAEQFMPQDDKSSDIKEYLLANLNSSGANETEPQLIDAELLAKIHEVVLAKYGDILAAVPETGDDVVYGPEQCKDIMTDALRATNLYDKGWRVELDPGRTITDTRAEDKRIYLPAKISRTALQLKQLIVHEQEVHARRGQNGDETGETPLARGTAGYADVEEGLGVLLECAVAGSLDNPAYYRARDRYILAGIALGADGTPRDARQSYEVMWRMLAVRSAKDGVIDDATIEKAKTLAQTHVDNAYRATNHAMPGVIYTKLKVYFEGLAKNVEYFRNFDGTIEEALQAAMIGKMNHTDPDEVSTVHELIAERAA